MAEVSSSSLKIHYPEWEREFQAALSEHEPGKLRERVTAGETAIFNRAQPYCKGSMPMLNGRLLQML